MAKNLYEYIAQNERTYSYRIKTIVPLDDMRMTAIENMIMKYDPIDITYPRKTIFQANPPDFINATPSGGAEVFIVDITLGLPASVLTLRQEVCRALSVADKFVVVRGANDPLENEVQRLEAEVAIAAEAEKAGLTPQALLDDPDYKEAEEFIASDLYGDAYNAKFVTYLKKIEDKKRAEAAAKMAKMPVSPLFDFIAPMADLAAQDKNALTTDREAESDNPANAYRSIQGNYDSDKKQFRRVFRTTSGKEKVLSKDADGVRKGK